MKFEIFIDEIEPEKGNNFIVLGALFVPIRYKKAILNKLLNYRCLKDENKIWYEKPEECPYFSTCKFHEVNNTEIHFSEIRDSRINNSKIEISKRWLKEFMNNENGLFVNVLFIDLNNLERRYFGKNRTRENIYNRFIRTLINYGLKVIISEYEEVRVENVFYDEKENLKEHPYFRDKNLIKLEKEYSGKLKINRKVTFLNSDHKKEENYPKESHFIQLIDLIIGAIRLNIFKTSTSEIKKEVALIIRPELDKLKKDRNNSNKLRVSFYPKNKIKKSTSFSGQEIPLENEYYYLKDIHFKLPPQRTTLTKWL